MNIKNWTLINLKKWIKSPIFVSICLLSLVLISYLPTFFSKQISSVGIYFTNNEKNKESIDLMEDLRKSNSFKYMQYYDNEDIDKALDKREIILAIKFERDWKNKLLDIEKYAENLVQVESPLVKIALEEVYSHMYRYFSFWTLESYLLDKSNISKEELKDDFLKISELDTFKIEVQDLKAPVFQDKKDTKNLDSPVSELGLAIFFSNIVAMYAAYRWKEDEERGSFIGQEDRILSLQIGLALSYLLPYLVIIFSYLLSKDMFYSNGIWKIPIFAFNLLIFALALMRIFKKTLSLSYFMGVFSVLMIIFLPIFFDIGFILKILKPVQYIFPGFWLI